MKKITTSIGVFGPFNSVKVWEDRYHCDGGDYPFTVVGQGNISDVVDGDFPAPEPASVTTPAPTKEQLLAELQALTAKINALG